MTSPLTDLEDRIAAIEKTMELDPVDLQLINLQYRVAVLLNWKNKHDGLTAAIEELTKDVEKLESE